MLQIPLNWPVSHYLMTKRTELLHIMQGLITRKGLVQCKGLDLLQVLIDQKESRFVRVTNKGSAAFGFEWNLGKELRLSVKPASGEVPAGQQTLCCLTFAPRSEKHRLNSLPVSCRISSGKQYNMLLTGALSLPPPPPPPPPPLGACRPQQNCPLRNDSDCLGRFLTE